MDPLDADVEELAAQQALQGISAQPGCLEVHQPAEFHAVLLPPRAYAISSGACQLSSLCDLGAGPGERAAPPFLPQ